MLKLWSIVQNWRCTHVLPHRILVLIIEFHNKDRHGVATDTANKSRVVSGFMTVPYHNKGIEMLNLPRILNSRYIRMPRFEQPMVFWNKCKKQ